MIRNNIVFESGGMAVEDAIMVEMLRRVRHDFANHFQVISGYEQLGMQERIKDYIATVIADMNAERIIFESTSPELALYLYAQLLKARDMGIILRYEDLSIQSLELLEGKNEPCESLALFQKDRKQTEDEYLVYLSLYEDDKGLDILISCEDLPQESRTLRVNRE